MVDDDIGGVWRTVGGRRIFIKDGQDLKTAMKESGKFKNIEGKSKKTDKTKEKTFDDIKEIKKGYDEIFKKYSEEYDKKFSEDSEKKYKTRKARIEAERKIEQQKKDFWIKRDEEVNKFISQQFNVTSEKEIENYRHIFTRLVTDGMPLEASFEISKWKTINQSPYSSSYYNADGISWNSKPEGSIRVSDHWNFGSNGEVHCQLAETGEYQSNRWLMAEYKKGKYYILKEFKE